MASTICVKTVKTHEIGVMKFKKSQDDTNFTYEVMGEGQSKCQKCKVHF